MKIVRFNDLTQKEKVIKIESFLISCTNLFPNIFKFDDISAYANKLSDLADGVVALEDEEFVGVCLGYFNNLDTKKAYISIVCSLYCDRNKGLGTILHDAFCKLSLAAGMESISLQVLKENKRALIFYEKMGYKIDADNGIKWLVKKVF